MSWRGQTNPVDRLWAALPYVMPIGSASLALLPLVPLQTLPPILVSPIATLLVLYTTVASLGGPYGGLLVFFGLYMFVVRNSNIAHFIRYNTMQSLMIGIMVTLAMLVLGVFQITLLPITMVIFACSMAASLYSLFYVVQGKYPEIKWISDAAYAQTQV